MANILSKIMGLQKRDGKIRFEEWNTRIFEAFLEAQKIFDQLSSASSSLGSAHYSRAYNSANINIATGVATALSFNSTEFQNAELHSNTSNPSRFTIQRDGFYTLHATIQWDAALAGVRRVGVRVNGTTIIASRDDQAAIAPIAAFSQEQTISTGKYLRAGDYLEVVVYQNSGGPVVINRQASYSPEAVVIQH